MLKLLDIRKKITRGYRIEAEFTFNKVFAAQAQITCGANLKITDS